MRSSFDNSELLSECLQRPVAILPGGVRINYGANADIVDSEFGFENLVTSTNESFVCQDMGHHTFTNISE